MSDDEPFDYYFSIMWEDKNQLQNIIAKQTNIVEIAAPLFTFNAWKAIHPYILNVFSNISNCHGTDWGPNFWWCSAVKDLINGSCMVVYYTSLIHTNTHSLNKNDQHFKRGDKCIEYQRNIYPEWFVNTDVNKAMKIFYADLFLSNDVNSNIIKSNNNFTLNFNNLNQKYPSQQLAINSLKNILNTVDKRYALLFRTNTITMKQLLKLNDQILKNDLSIKSKSKREKILYNIKILSKNETEDVTVRITDSNCKCLNDIYDAIFVISILTRYETLSITLSQLISENIDFILWQGHSSDNVQSIELWNNYRSKWKIPPKLKTKSTDSAYFSPKIFFLRQTNMDIIHYSLNNNYSKILILEDDILLADTYWFTLFCKIEPNIPEWWILNLSINIPHIHKANIQYINISNFENSNMKYYQMLPDSYGVFATSFSYQIYQLMLNIYDMNSKPPMRSHLPLDSYQHILQNPPYNMNINNKFLNIQPTLFLPDTEKSILRNKTMNINEYIYKHTTDNDNSRFQKYWKLRFGDKSLGFDKSPSKSYLQNNRYLQNNSNDVNLCKSITYQETTTKWDKSCGVVMFYDISKTGGTNFMRVFTEKLKRHNNVANEEKFRYKYYHISNRTDDYNATYILYSEVIPFIKNNIQNNKILYIHQHHQSLSFVEMIEGNYLQELKDIVSECNCSFIYITLFRNPIQRAISSLAFNKIPKHRWLETCTTAKLCTNEIIGYLNYNILYNRAIAKNPPLTTDIIIKTFKLLHQFDIIGFNEGYNEFLSKVFSLTNIEYAQDEFNKSLYTKKINKLTSQQKKKQKLFPKVLWIY
eukprot:539028_1